MFGCGKKRCSVRRGAFGGIRVDACARVKPGLGEAALAELAGSVMMSNGETLLDASRSRPLALVFLRHFGCTFTRQILRSLETIEAEARRMGADLVLVHMLRSGSELSFLKGHNDVLRIADPKCELYRAFGLGKGGVVELFGPRVIWLGAVSVFKGCGVGHLAGSGRQMPGAFLFHDGRIVSAQRAKTAADLPDLPALFDSSKPVHG